MSNKDDFMKKLLGAIKAAAGGDSLSEDEGTVMVDNKVEASIRCAEAVKAINDGKSVEIGVGIAPCGCHLMLLKIPGTTSDYGFGCEQACEFAEIARASIGFQDHASDAAKFEMMKLITVSSTTSAAIMARHALGHKHGDMFYEQLHVGASMLQYLIKLRDLNKGEAKASEGLTEIRKGQPAYEGAVQFIKAAHEKVMPKARNYQKAMGLVTDAASVKPAHIEHMAKSMVQYNGTSGRGMGIMHVMKDGSISIDSKAENYADVIGTLFASMTLAGEADVVLIAGWGDGMAKLVADAEQKIVDDGNFDKQMNGPLGTLRGFAEGIKAGKPETMEKFNELCMSSTENGKVIPIDPKDLATEKSVGTVH